METCPRKGRRGHEPQLCIIGLHPLLLSAVNWNKENPKAVPSFVIPCFKFNALWFQMRETKLFKTYS